MKRIVVRIQAQQSGQDLISLEHSDTALASTPTASEFTGKPVAEAIVRMGQGVLSPQIVGDAGNWLYDKMVANQSVQEALNVVLGVNDEFPIYIELRSDDAEALPWEALRKPDGKFLTLDKRWPIGRIAPTGDTGQEYHLDLPIKMTVVLSATGVDARPEWDVLWAAISGAEVPVNLQVLLCQSDLEAHIKSLNLSNVTVSYITDSMDLLKSINKFEPNIIHFFCHGSTEQKATRLLLATKSDWLTGNSSIQIYPSDLAGGSTPLNAWLVTLNCCRGAAPVEQAQSLARSLVTEGFPAVVGMREVVASTDAHIFCRGFYNLVFGELKEYLQSSDKWVEICWAKMLYEARQRLAMHHANGQVLPNAAAELKEWTLPILYVRREPFRIRGRSKNQQLSESEKQKKQTLLTMLRQSRDVFRVAPGTPASVLADFDDQIAQLEAELYPGAPPQG